MALSDLDTTERKIIGAILDRIAELEQPVIMEIYGDHELDIAGDFDRRLAEKNIGACDTTKIVIKDGEARGWVFLVHGNSADVVSQYGGNAAGYRMMTRIVSLPGEEF